MDIFCFDFDGVVCNSCDECTATSLKAMRQKWPEISWPEIPSPWLLEQMLRVRPIIETGWELVPAARLLLERQSQGQGATAAEELAGDWQTELQCALKAWEVSEAEMIELFGSTRDSWMADDLGGWLNANSFYGDVPELLTSCKGEAFVITTKQQRFAVALMRHAGVLDIPEDNILGLGMYKSKADALVTLKERKAAALSSPSSQSVVAHFFEDRWPTLLKCLKDDRLKDGVRFYLCDWGYVTPEDLEAAAVEPRVEVIDQEQLRGIVGR